MNRKNEIAGLIKHHQKSLAKAAEDKKKQWWERYMKNVIPFRGVGIPDNRKLLAALIEENGIAEWPQEEQLELALAFFKEPFAEDKLAGILYLQEYLCRQLPWEPTLEKFEDLFNEQLIFDWNICDWFCVRVLGPMIEENGIECAQKISAWKNADYLWHARASVVAFVNLVSDSSYYHLIMDSASTLIQREERFAKTAVGWILLEISKYDEPAVIRFIKSHLQYFSKESLSNALKHFDADLKKKHLEKLKNIKKGTSISKKGSNSKI